MGEKNASRPPVFVTRALIPSEDAFMERLRAIFSSHQLTNQGPCVQQLEKNLAHMMEVPTLSLCANGTLALQLAIRLLGLNGKTVITTPFTYVATVSALLWEGCTPLFADIDPRTLCLCPEKTERLIRKHPETAGILPVHVYGNACDVAAMRDLGQRYGLPVLYDAAHAFGSRLHGKSLFAWGDAATGSFHATKLFHTVEGGCIVSPHAGDQETLRLLRAFGHCDDNHIRPGINAKMSELHAAVGLCLLPQLPEILRGRAARCALYDAVLPWDYGLRGPRLAPGLEWNHAYYPVIFPDGAVMRAVLAALEARDIHPRRYFYPSLTKLPYLQSPSCPEAEDVAERVLCLPLWPDMEEDLIREIGATVSSVMAGA